MTKDQIEDLLEDVLGSPKMTNWKGDKIQFCCTVHGESNPSCGINIDYRPANEPNKSMQVFHCFSCGAGGTIPWLVLQSLPDRFKNIKEVDRFLLDRYGVTYSYSYDPKSGTIKRYEDFYTEKVESRKEVPLSKLAPFKSGKQTYQYFFDRGFDKEDMKKYMIGRDLESETVTFPVFWENGKLAGIIGRYIDPNRPKNMRFRIYNFSKSDLIFPLDKVQTINDTLIGMEANIDSMMLEKWGYPNAVSIMGAEMSDAQADQIASRCKKFIDLFDNDEGGRKARYVAKKKLTQRGVLYLVPTYYPKKGKDPTSWGELETVKVIESATLFNTKGIPRL